MNAHLAASLAVLEELYADLEAFVADLEFDALNWSPLPDETNTIAALVRHIAGSNAAWLSKAADEPVERDRDAEFRARLPADEVVALLDRSRAEMRRRFQRLQDVDPATIRAARRLQGQSEVPVTVGWCVEHAIIHTGEHWGQIQLTRQLYAARNSTA